MKAVAQPFSLEATGPLTLAIADLRLTTDPAGGTCPVR